MERAERRSVAPFYAVAVIWLVWGAFFPLYAVGHYLLLAAVSAAVFLAVGAVCKNAGVVGGTEQAAPKAAQEPGRRPPATRRWTKCSGTAAWPSRR